MPIYVPKWFARPLIGTIRSADIIQKMPAHSVVRAFLFKANSWSGCCLLQSHAKLYSQSIHDLFAQKKPPDPNGWEA